MLILLTLLQLSHADNWRSDFPPQSDCLNCRQYYRPGSNFTSVVAYKDSLVIGGRNALFELNFQGLNDVIYEDRIIETDDYEYCIAEAGQQPLDCHNYYTMLLKISDTNLFVCGTSSFSPSCGTRLRGELNYKSNEAKVDYISANPYSSMDYLRLRDSNYTAYVGTEKGSNTGGFLIASVNMMPGSYAIKASTPTESNTWLNAPTFIYSFETEDYVYFVYQEIAVEISPERVYSRISRICKDDTGDTSPFFNKKFLTFAKVRIQCSYSQAGQAPYQFDRISGAYYHGDYLYTVFSGSNTIIETGSVFCLFKMSDVENAFEGKYKYFEYGRWQDTMPSGAPFTCGGDPNWTTAQALKYQMLAEVLKSEQVIYYSKDQLSNLDMSLTTIKDKDYRILHSGSRTGKLVRVGFHINRFSELESIRSIDMRAGIGTIKTITRDESGRGDIYVIANDWVTHVPLASDCSVHVTCQSCQRAFPGCGWCVSRTLRSTCTTSDQCATDNWKSAFEQCAPLASFEVRPHNVTVAHMAPVVIDCVSRNNAGSYWINETGVLSPDRVKLPLNGSLVISHAQEWDNGCYVCELRGESGVVSQQACITVLIPPFFYADNSVYYTDGVIEVDLSKDVSLPCRAGGSPKPEIIWRKMGGGVLPEGAYVGPDGELRIIRAIKDDAGQYQCNAKNSVGQNWSDSISLNVLTVVPNQNTIAQNKKSSLSNRSMISLVSTVSVVLVIVVLSLVFAHCYCKRKSKKKQFLQLEQQDMLPGYSTYLDPRLTPIGSLRDPRDASLNSADAFRQCYSETSTPRWLPPHTIMSAPLSGDHVPPPPYQQYFMERHLLSQERAVYENVMSQRGQLLHQPPSPTEQVPISFSEGGYYVPFNPARVPSQQGGTYSSPRPPVTYSSPRVAPGHVGAGHGTAMRYPDGSPLTSPVYSSASYNMCNPMFISTTRPPLSNPLERGDSPPGGQGRRGSQSLPRETRTHVYDEIVVPEGGVISPSSEVPPVPPRPSRTPSRKPPAIPLSPTEIEEDTG